MKRFAQYILTDRTQCYIKAVANQWNSILEYTNLSVDRITKINGITTQYCRIHSNSLDYTTLCSAMATHFEVSQRFNKFILRCQDYEIQEVTFFVRNDSERDHLECYLTHFTSKTYTDGAPQRKYFLKSIIICMIDDQLPLDQVHQNTKLKWILATKHIGISNHISFVAHQLKILGLLQADLMTGVWNNSERNIYLVGEAHAPLRIDQRFSNSIIPIDELYKTIFTFCKCKIDFYLESPVSKERLVAGGSNPMTWGSLRVLRETFFDEKDLDPVTMRPNLHIYGQINNENKIRAHWNDVRQTIDNTGYEYFTNSPMNNVLRILYERKNHIAHKNLKAYVSDFCKILPEQVEFSHVFKYVFHVFEKPLTYANQKGTHQFLKDKYDQNIKKQIIVELKRYIEDKTGGMTLVQKFVFLIHRMVGIYTMLRIHYHPEQQNIIIHTGYHHTQFILNCLTTLFGFEVKEQSNKTGKILMNGSEFTNKSDISSMTPWFI